MRFSDKTLWRSLQTGGPKRRHASTTKETDGSANSCLCVQVVSL